MPRVCLQAGHYPNGGGAPGEAAWTYDLAQRIGGRLKLGGVAATIVGAWALDNSNPPPQIRVPYDLFVSLHFDADIYPVRTGCFAGRAANDPNATQSYRAIVAWEAVYPEATGIPLHKERLNVNVTDYYAFRVTEAHTPGILIEHGVGQGDDHSMLFNHIDVVAKADADAIFNYLGLGLGAPDVTPQQQQILDAAARQGLDAAGIDNMMGVNRTLGEQVNSLSWLLRTSQDETQAQAAEVARLQALPAASPAPEIARVNVLFEDGRVETYLR